MGIFGGTFNPPHLGHLLLAMEAKEKAKLDGVVFMPCAIPPHKPHAEILDGEHRLNMVKLAIGGYEDFAVSDMEIMAGGKSYTAKTLQRLNELYPNEQICLIVGADSLCDMESWFCPGEIFKRAEIVVAGRGGMKDSALNVAVDLFRQKYDAKITVISMSQIELSSTDIRKRIREGKPIKFMLPDSVIDYICENGLYEEK